MKPPTVPTGLPFNLEDLIHQRTIESNRVELKTTWDPHTRTAIVRTVCAFANDVLNLNGGYVVIGIEEQGGRAELPPRGLVGRDLERLQKEIRGVCQRIDPGYQPYLFPVEYQEQPILIVWAPGGDNRPYQAPDNVDQRQSPRHFYLRQGPETVKARGESLRQLMELAAKIPFDDRRALTARLEDISPSLVRRFVHLIGSKLVNLLDIHDHALRTFDISHADSHSCDLFHAPAVENHLAVVSKGNVNYLLNSKHI